MPKKLTMFGVLMALVFGATAVFHGTATATPGPVQGFDNTGTFTVNAGTCWDQDTTTGNGEEHPSKTADVSTGGQVICGPNTSEVHAPLGVGTTAVRSFTYIQLPQGMRLTLPITFTPSAAGEFGTDPTKAACGSPTPGSCGLGSSVTGSVTAYTDLLCSGPAYDVLAKPPKVGTPVGWPDDPSDGNGWTGFDFNRTADNTATGVPGGANAYVNQIQPFPAAFAFVSLDTATLTTLFLGGGGAGFPIPNTPLQLYTGTSSYRAGLNVSVALLGGNPQNPPTNDYLCLDSPQDSETNTDYVVPPTTSGLYPRWVIFTSAADFVNGAVNRIVDLQCVGVGTVTSGAGATDVGATDADDDCLATPADTNDGNPDQDADGLPDGIEANAGSSITAADADGDLANDYEEMFNFTDPNDNDTDNDGSLDKTDNGADEVAGSLVIDDTIADDNCPADANADQLNTDSAQSYHGGNDAWANKNAGTTAVPPAGGPPANTLVSTWASATLSVTGTTATVTTSSAHGLFNNQLVEISGITGMGGTAAQNNAFRQATNGVRAAGGITATTFTFAIPTLAPASPSPVASGAVTGTIVIRPATGDVSTNNDQDVTGDACDTDDDNDAIGDVAEGNVTYLAVWPGAGTTSCKGDGTGVAGVIALKTTNGDSDQDMVMDGIECQQGARPDISATAAAPCTPASAGCAQPKAAIAGEDGDADGLYASGGVNSAAENFYHTGQINQTNNVQVTDIDGDGSAGVADRDSDADWNIAALPVKPWVTLGQSNQTGLQDGVEVRFYSTDPSNGDTDSDGCDDGREAADINGDRTVNPGDQATTANRLATIAALDNGKAGDPTSGDGQVNPYGINFDQNKDKSINPGDQALVSFYVGKGGACQTTRQQGKVAGTATKLPF